LNPLQGPAQTHSDLIINKHTEQAKNYPWLSKKFQTHPPKAAEAKPSFRKVSLSLAKLCMLSSLTSGLESFGHKSTPPDRPWIEAYCPNF